MAVTSNLSFLGKIGTIDRGLGIYNFSAQFPLYIYYYDEAAPNVPEAVPESAQVGEAVHGGLEGARGVGKPLDNYRSELNKNC